MNIIYLNTHDTGRFIEPYGYAVKTPRLMELAREGTLFRNAFSMAPTCSPSRAALLTGTAPHSCGMLGLAHLGFRLNDYSHDIGVYLRRHGYESVRCGVQHTISHYAPKDVTAEVQGYDEILHSDGSAPSPRRQPEVPRDIQNAHAVAEYLRRPHDKPFFLSFGLGKTHRAFTKSPPDVNPDYVKPPFPVPDTPETRADYAGFLHDAGIVDECVGIVLETLAETGLDKDTLLCFTTDHGIDYPRMKCTLRDTGVGVSLLLRYPENPMRGRATDALVSHVDLFPTFCDIAGVPKPDRLQGVSLLPLLEGRVDAVRQEVFAESTFHVTYDPMRAVRTKEYKLIKRFGELETPPAPNIGDQVTKDILRDRGYFGRRRPRVLLFDLVLDPVERVNLAEDPEYRAIRDELESKLEDWMRKTRDPLLDGPVHAPFPRALNDPTTYTNQPSPERKEEIRRIGAMWNRTEEWPTGKTPAD